MAGSSISGAPSTPKARSSTCWSRLGGTNQQRFNRCASFLKKYGFVPDKFVTDKLRSLCRRQSSWNRKTPRAWPIAQQSSGEFASANPTKGDEDARVPERGIRAKISLNPRSHLQHLQRPTPSDIGKNAPSLQGIGHAGVAREVVAAACFQLCNPTNPHQSFNNVTTPYAAMSISCWARSIAVAISFIRRVLFP